MKLGTVISEETIQMVGTFATGAGNRIVGLRHPRCGWVVITKDVAGVWRVTSIDKPDVE